MSGNDTSLCDTLTPSQRQQTMSAMKQKKKKKKGTIRPILMNPLKLTPIQIDNRSNLSNILRRELTQAVEKDTDKVKIPMTRASLTLGVNATYRSLQKENFVGAVVLASDITPESLVTHVVRRCEVRAVPVSRLSNLRQVTKDVLGFSCICLGLLIRDGEYKETIDFMAIKQPKVVAPEVNVPPDLEDCIESNQVNVVDLELNEASELEEGELRDETVDQGSESDEIPFRNFHYLKRDSNKVRAFIPRPKAAITTSQGTGFISIANQDFRPAAASIGISMNVNKVKGNKRKRNFATDLNDSDLNVKKKKKKMNSEVNSPMKVKSPVKAKLPVFVPAKVNKVISNYNRKNAPKKSQQ